MALRNAGVRVAELAGRGKSLLATRSLAPHELIFREAPLVRVSKNTRDPATAAHPVADTVPVPPSMTFLPSASLCPAASSPVGKRPLTAR